jgi:hypothetical protein
MQRGNLGTELVNYLKNKVRRDTAQNHHGGIHARNILSDAIMNDKEEVEREGRKFGFSLGFSYEIFERLGRMLCYVSKGVQKILQTSRNYLPTVSRILFNTRFKVLSGKRLPDLFDMSLLAPVRMKKFTESVESGKLHLTQILLCVQLTVFRMIRDKQKFSEDFIDKTMTDWLVRLGESRWREMPRIHKPTQRVPK